MIILLILLILRFTINYIIEYIFNIIKYIFNKKKIKNTYDELIFNKQKLDNSIIENSLNRILQEKKNQIDEYYKLLLFFWGFQVATITFILNIVIKIIDIENLDIASIVLYFNKQENNYIVTGLLFIMALNYIITIIQIFGLHKKESIIINYLYHILYLENKLNININGFFINKNNNGNGVFSNQSLYECMHIVLVFWEVLIAFGICIINNIEITIINIGIIIGILEILQASYLCIRKKIINHKSINIDDDIFAIQLNTFIKK
ncbi:hypothetical protein [uncultured Brachyspira sp.]|uniref:hypothetical protein n=1 Tax=uncultured Brachyspira sp. TaxID=221953 RepID=UPI0025D722D8|nr:hypothetical protein [uncultured Brachyspira sp.]